MEAPPFGPLSSPFPSQSLRRPSSPPPRGAPLLFVAPPLFLAASPPPRGPTSSSRCAGYGDNNNTGACTVLHEGVFVTFFLVHFTSSLQLHPNLSVLGQTRRGFLSVPVWSLEFTQSSVLNSVTISFINNDFFTNTVQNLHTLPGFYLFLCQIYIVKMLCCLIVK